MNYKIIYYITHYLWLFQLLFNIFLFIKAILFKKKYKKNSLILSRIVPIVFPIIMELTCGYVFIMFDYIANTRINGPFYGVVEICITLCLLMSHVFLWFASSWRLTYENDRFIYHKLFFGQKTILFDEIDYSKSYIVKPKDPKFLHLDLYEYIVFVLKNGEKIKVMFESYLCSDSSIWISIQIEKFLVKKLKFKVKVLTDEEYKREKKLI